jgi:predicted transcriptional regulator
MKRILIAVVIGAIAVACAGHAQRVVEAPVIVPRATLRTPDSVSFKPSPELQKALDELAASVHTLATRVANDPQLRSAAMQVAAEFVTTAQQVVNEQTVVLQEAIKTAAQRIAEAQAAQRSHPRKP